MAALLSLTEVSSGFDDRRGVGRPVDDSILDPDARQLEANGTNAPDSPHGAVRFAPLPASHVPAPALQFNRQAGTPLSALSQDEHNILLPTHSAPSIPGVPSTPNTPATLATDMIFSDSSHEHIEIDIPSDLVILRGVGQNVEPVLFSGKVILRLSEDTNIREVNLNFTGKAKFPQPEVRQPAFRQPVVTHSIFSHDWSFLEGPKNHRHTLKAGQHVFPFQLNINDTFPTSVSVGNASITYKLRATVVRSSFNSNWVAQRYVSVLHGFSPEALEYTQTLEIENTWPGKVMYSVMIPHKAVAAGDDIPVGLKFTPLVKGCTVLSVEIILKQYTSIRTKGALPVQDARVVAKGNWVIQSGEAVAVPIGPPAVPEWDVNSAFAQTSRTSAGNGLPPTTSRQTTDSGSSGTGASIRPSGNDVEIGDGELDTFVKLPLPAWVTPSNLTDPVTVIHKLKWSITLSNLDGHTSELRCALPIHVLSHSLLEEARAASQQTRAVLFGSNEVETTQTILPSYASHVQDRIANALDMPGPVHLAPNPLHNLDSSSGPGTPSSGLHTPAGYFGVRGSTTSHPDSPSAAHSRNSHCINDSSGLDFVDTGLLLSLGDNATNATTSRADSTSDSRRSSFRTNRISSSRTSSRATSPERADVDLPAPSTSGPSSLNARTGMFSLPLSLKPFTTFSNKNSKCASQAHHASNPSSPNITSRSLGFRSRQSSSSNLRSEYQGMPSSLPSTTPAESMSQLLNRVPNYERASQGFLGGGVPPLDVSAGLPAYQEVEMFGRVHSEGTLLDLRGAVAGMYGNETPVPRSSRSQPRSTSDAMIAPASGGVARPATETETRRRNATFTLDP